MTRRDGDAFLRKERERLRAYRATEKGKAALRVYNASPAGRARRLQWHLSAKAKAGRQSINARRIYVGRFYHSSAPTPELAQQIKAHVKRELHEFSARQRDRRKAEDSPECPVPREASL